MPRPRVALASIACAIVLGVTACSPTDADGPEGSAAPPSAAATDEPIFASDEEALAAAVEAYEAYVAASARVARSGGEGSESITPLIGPEFDAVVQDEFAALRESKLRLIGESVHYNERLESFDLEGENATVKMLVCRDISGTRLVRTDGEDVTPEGRDLIQASRVDLSTDGPGSANLIVVGAERLEDEEGC